MRETAIPQPERSFALMAALAPDMPARDLAVTTLTDRDRRTTP